MRHFCRLARGIVGGGELHILGNVDQHRAGAAVGCDMKGLVHGFGQFGGVFDQPVHLGAGAGDAHGIRLLEAIGADHKGGHLAGNHDQRNGIHQGIGQARHRIRGPRARGDQRHPGLTGRAGIALGHMDSALFMAHQNVLDVILLKNLVIDRQHGPTGITKHHLDALIFQRLHHHSCPGHLPHRLVLYLNKKPPKPLGARGQACQRRPDRGGQHARISPLVSGVSAGTLGLGCGGVNRKSTRKMSWAREKLNYCCENQNYCASFGKSCP